MDAPASPPAPDRPAIKARLATLEGQIKDMRRELDETLELIERLRVSCTRMKAKLEAAEAEHAMLSEEAGRLLRSGLDDSSTVV